MPDAEAALVYLRHAAADRPYDLAVVDMAMPGMDGLELARAISADPALNSVRVVLLSSVRIDPETAASAGVAARLTKPARLSQLYATLVQAVTPVAVAIVVATTTPPNAQVGTSWRTPCRRSATRSSTTQTPRTRPPRQCLKA
ncbi:MAG: response regulator [Acidimicrobiales bacterium]